MTRATKQPPLQGATTLSTMSFSIVAQFCFGECRYAECHYAEYRYAECHYAECRYAVCRYAECRGAILQAEWE